MKNIEFLKGEFVDYKGIHYVAHSIIDNKCYFKKTVNHKDNDLDNISVSDMDEVWIQHNRNNHNINRG